MKKTILILIMLVTIQVTAFAQEEQEKTAVVWSNGWEYFEDPENNTTGIHDYFWCEDETAQIHVAVDGEEISPNFNGSEYSILSGDEMRECLVTAYAVADGKLPSDTISEVVQIPAFEPFLRTEGPYIGFNYPELLPTEEDFIVVDNHFYQKCTARIDVRDTEATTYYRIIDEANHETVLCDWTEYDGEPIYYETVEPVIIEAYSIAERKLESDHAWASFSFWREPDYSFYYCDFVAIHEQHSLYYKITGDSTVSVCTLKWDQYDYCPMYEGAYSGDIVIPETVTCGDKVYTITGIDQAAFGNCPELSSVSLPGTIEHIDRKAFILTPLLTTIKIPSSTVSIASGAFDAYSLSRIEVETGNAVYDSRDNCNAIIETASNTLIAGCMNTVIPNNVAFIGDYAFDECVGLNVIEIPNSVTGIGNGAFSACRGLTSLTIPNTVISIGNSAFSLCDKLTSVHLPDSITSIGESLFYCCYELTDVNIPNSVTSIGDFAFAGCDNLVNMVILNSVTYIGSRAFLDCDGLASVNMVNANVSNSVTTIGEEAFENCDSLSTVTISNSVTAIGRNAFSCCYSITRVISQATTPPSGSRIFPDYDFFFNQATLFVPAESLEAYRAHEEWGKFSRIVPFIGAGPGDTNGDGVINIADVTGLIDQLLYAEELPAYIDVNGDGMVNITDVTTLIDRLLGVN